MEKKKASSNLIITELFLVKADWTRTFMGEIRREVDSNGNPFITCEVLINDGKAFGRGSTDEELRKNMDSICRMKLDYNLHSHSGESIQLFGKEFFLN
jgi:hypothetical protein